MSNDAFNNQPAVFSRSDVMSIKDSSQFFLFNVNRKIMSLFCNKVALFYFLVKLINEINYFQSAAKTL